MCQTKGRGHRRGPTDQNGGSDLGGHADYRDYEALTAERLPSGVVIGTLNRPERLNAFNGQMRHSIRRLVGEVRRDPLARVLVITGAGRGFCSGADLATEDQRTWPTAPQEPRFSWAAELLELPKPTIAAVNGAAAGGGLGLALLCDIVICSTAARLLPIWLRRAIHPDDLITWTLPRLVGYSRALRWLYLAEDIPLDEAEESGLVESVVPPEELMERTLALATRSAAGPTAHFALTKQAVSRGMAGTPLDSVLLESWGADRVATFQDSGEGAAAFRERRDPNFLGR